MARKVTGYVEWRGGRWQVQATDKSGVRDWHELPKTIRQEQTALAQAVGTRVAQKLRVGEYVPGERDLTVSEWFEKYFAWRGSKGWADAKTTLGQFRKHLEPDIGHMPMSSVRRDHLKAFVTKLDDLVVAGELAWKTAGNLFSALISKPFKDATDGKEPSLCVLGENPATGLVGPEKGARVRKQYLYPSEALQLLSSEKVPLWRRRLYAFAIWTYTRVSEIAALEWDDVDLDHDMIVIHQAVNHHAATGRTKATKSDEERRVPIETTLRPLLQTMFVEASTDLVFPKMPPYNGHDGQAATLRADLEAAGVTRAALHKRVKTRKWLVFHDLRASGLTWCAVRGDDPLRMMSRSGHRNYETLLVYVREAEVVREGFGEVFPPLPAGLLGKTQIEPKSPDSTPKRPTKGRPQRDSNPC